MSVWFKQSPLRPFFNGSRLERWKLAQQCI